MRTLFKDGLVYDGTDNAPVREDVMVEDDKIIPSEGQCDRIIDCRGLCVTPGWIDAHSHNDFFYDRDSSETFYQSFLKQGITTQVTGNCGFSVFGVEPGSQYKDKVGAGLFWTDNAGTYSEFKKRAQGNLLVNMAPLIGHGTARIGVNGLAPGKLTQKQSEQMLGMVDEAMEGGAFGGSFGLMYEPGMYAPREELVEFASRIAAHDGILTVHPRACSRVSMDYPLISRPHIELALEEVIDIARKSGCHTEYSHLIFVGQTSWKCIDPMLKKFKQAREEGIDIAFDNYSFLYGASVITVVCPAWYMAMDKQKRHSPLSKAKLAVLVNMSRKLLGIGFEDMTIAWISPDHPEYEGHTVAEIARSEGKSELDEYLDLVDLSDGKGKIYFGKYYNEELVRRLMNEDLSVFMTDAWIEEAGIQNGAAFQCFPNFLELGAKYGIPTEKIIHKMTGASALRFKIPERGFIRPGLVADITVFSPDKLKVDTANPAFTPQGIQYVMVNGAMAIDNGSYRTQHAGKVLSMASKS